MVPSGKRNEEAPSKIIPLLSKVKFPLARIALFPCPDLSIQSVTSEFCSGNSFVPDGSAPSNQRLLPSIKYGGKPNPLPLVSPTWMASIWFAFIWTELNGILYKAHNAIFPFQNWIPSDAI